MPARNFKNTTKYGLWGLLFLIIILYSLFRTKDLIFGVKLQINGVTDGASYGSPLLILDGRARNAVDFTLNGRGITINKDGYFRERLLLIPGYNIISFVARDKFGHEDKEDYQVFLKK